MNLQVGLTVRDLGGVLERVPEVKDSCFLLTTSSWMGMKAEVGVPLQECSTIRV